MNLRNLTTLLMLAAGAASAQTTLQRCMGIAPGRPAGTPNPTSSNPACRQIPGFDVYEQAGKRFMAGDHAGAARLLAQSAGAGNPLASLRLAMMYEAGDGVARDKRQAFAYYKQGAEAGEPASQNELGGYYEVGDGDADDWVLAAQWYAKSAAQGWNKGEASLGRAYQYGIGVPLNLNTAILWYEKSAAQGNKQADYFAHFLRNNHGYDTSSRNDEEQRMLGPLIGRSVLTAPPVGRTFRNISERMQYIRWQAGKESNEKAQRETDRRQREYDDCRRAGRDFCYKP
jgi:TPR repeat protein